MNETILESLRHRILCRINPSTFPPFSLESETLFHRSNHWKMFDSLVQRALAEMVEIGLQDPECLSCFLPDPTDMTMWDIFFCCLLRGKTVRGDQEIRFHFR